MNNIDILNDLADYVTIKMNSCFEVYHPKSLVESKMHSDYDIWLITEGSMSIEINGISHDAATGDVIFFYPEISYTAYMGQQGCRFIFIHFDFSIGYNFRILSDFNFSGIIPKIAVCEEVEYFKQAWYDHEKSKVFSILLKGHFTILITAIMNAYCNNEIVSFLYDQQQKSTGKLSALQSVFKYISENMDTRIKISELSSVAGMSEKYFICYFKSALGVTPNIYVTQLKMNRARDFIYKGKYSVKQIALMLGYSDQYSFSKAFKKYYNVAPSKFL